jgi:hypothetical protein
MTDQTSHNSLYSLSNEVEKVIQEVVFADGELSPELEWQLDKISGNFKAKAGNIAKWCLNLDANVPGLEQEIKRLQNRLRVQNNLRTRLTNYIKFCMENAGLHKLDMGTFTISIDKNPPSVGVITEELLPSKYIRVVQTQSVDKKQLLQDLKDGEKIEGAVLITDKTRLTIR